MSDRPGRARYDLWRSRPEAKRTRLLASGRLHAAMAVALVVAAFLGLSFPLMDRGGPSSLDQAPPGTPVVITADGLSYSFQSRAQTVAGALAEAGVTLNPGDIVLRQDVPVHPTSALRPPPLAVAELRAAQGGTAPPLAEPIVLRLQRAMSITVHEGGLALSLRSSQQTVGEALAAAGIQVGPADIVTPSLETPLAAGQHIYVQHANAVQLLVGDQTDLVYTFSKTVLELLQEQGVVWDQDDRIEPALDVPIADGLAVTVTFVRVDTEVTEQVLTHTVIYRDDPDLEIGQTQVLTFGHDGYIRRQYRVRYENGLEVGRELISQDEFLPVDRVIARGTKIVPQRLVLADGTVITYTQALEMYATWYNAASSGGDGITATGARLDVGIVAVDPRVIPLGTRLYIPGYGFAVAADTGGAITGNRIDLGYPGDTRGWCCTGRITVYILE